MTFYGYEKLQAKEFIGLSTFQFLAYFRRSIFYGFVAVYLGKVLLLTTTEVTLMATIGMIANTGSQSLIWGNLLDRFKRSVLFIVIGETIAGIGHILMYWWHFGILQLGNTRFAGFTIIIGLGAIEVFWSQSNVGWSALISELTEEDKRKGLMSQLSIIGGIGGITGATLGGFLYLGGQGFQNGNLFIIPAVIMMLSAVLVYVSIRDPSERLNEDEEYQKQICETSSHSLGDLPKDLTNLYLLFLVSLVFINFGRNSIALISNLYIVDPGAYGASDQQLALFRNVSSASTMVAGLLLGTILSEVNDLKVIITGIVFAMSAIIWMIFAPTFGLVLISSAFIGATHVIIQASSYAIVARLIPIPYRGRLFAYYNATFFLSWGIGATLITGPIADYFISQGKSAAFGYQMSFVAAVALVLVGFSFLLVFIVKLRNTNIEKIIN